MEKKKLSKSYVTRVLCFSPMKRLISIHQSITMTAKQFHTSSANIHFACTGESISSCGFYFRFLSDNIEVTQEDLGTLRLEEYDDLCGVKRKYYPTKIMSRSKTNKTTEQDNEN